MDLSHQKTKVAGSGTGMACSSWGFRCKTTADRDEQLRFWRFRNVRLPFNGFWFQGADITLEKSTDRRWGNPRADSRTTHSRYFGCPILPGRVPVAWREWLGLLMSPGRPVVGTRQRSWQRCTVDVRSTSACGKQFKGLIDWGTS